MAGQEATFIAAVQTAVLAVEISTGVKAFAHCHIHPGFSVDMDALVRIPRFPCAVINEGGFSINVANGKIKNGAFTVTVCEVKPRDPSGEAALLSLMDIGDKLVTALEYSTADTQFRAVSRAGSSTFKVAGMVIVTRAYGFVYEMQRT